MGIAIDYGVWAPRVLALLRIMVGLLFLEHGTQKLLGFPASPNPGPALLSLMGIQGIIELVAIARRHGKSVAQVALRWLIQQDGVAAIPRSSKREHIAANFALFDFALSAEEMAAIDRLRGATRVVSPSFAPAWDPPG